MSQRFERPELHLCGDCVERSLKLTPDSIGGIHSRHFNAPISEITREQMENKVGDPPGWLDHVEQSIIANGVTDRIGVIDTRRRFEISEGNHRAWIAYQHSLTVVVDVFTEMCGQCTEALFIDVLNAQTRTRGWLHHQQGF